LTASALEHLSAQAPAAPTTTTTTFMVKNGESPWSDRVGTWQLAGVPASVDGNGPLPQQSCGARSITVPANAKYVVVGVSNKDLDKFKGEYTTATPTGDSISVTHADGTQGIPYTVFKLPAPPATVGDKDFAAGLILLQVDDKPGATTPSTNAPTATPPPAPAAAK